MTGWALSIAVVYVYFKALSIKFCKTLRIHGKKSHNIFKGDQTRWQTKLVNTIIANNKPCSLEIAIKQFCCSTLNKGRKIKKINTMVLIQISKHSFTLCIIIYIWEYLSIAKQSSNTFSMKLETETDSILKSFLLILYVTFD